MRIVGLTGGISSGKSTVSNLFKANGIPIVDADLVARDVVEKGTAGWKKVVSAFGEEILQANGEIDRPKLGQIIFADPGKRKLLNHFRAPRLMSRDISPDLTSGKSLLFAMDAKETRRKLIPRLLAPYISSGILWKIVKLWMKGYKVIVLDIPLLFEAKMDRWTKPTIVVWVDAETQLRRLVARDGQGDDEARNRINAQMALDLKRDKADIVIDNTGSLDELNERFQEVLSEVTKPLSWTEFMLSRQGALSTLAIFIFSIFTCRKFNIGGV